MTVSVYRIEGGLILRVIEAADGGLKVETLKDGVWIPGRIGMVGLRLSKSTTMLSAKEAAALPQ